MLENNKCEACRIGAPKVTDEEKKTILKELPDWNILDDGVEKLVKDFKVSSYMEAVDFTKKVAEMADEEDHHPKIILEWGKVTVYWWSHKIEALHKNDFICAAKTDSLA